MYYRTVLKSVNVKDGMELFLSRFKSSEKYSLNELAKKSLIYDEKGGYVMKSPYGSVSIPHLINMFGKIWKNGKITSQLSVALQAKNIVMPSLGIIVQRWPFD